jgi:hypothetical protein
VKAAALALLVASAPAAPDVAATLSAVARDRSPRTAFAATRVLASAPVDQLASLLVEGSAPGAVDAAGRERVQLVLAEALAARRDPSAGPALRAVLRDARRAAPVAAAAARGLGRLCRDEDLALLMELARAGQAHDAAALEGLASCRRLPSAEHVAGRLDRAQGGELDRLAAVAGRLGSSWAWAAMGPERAEEGVAARRTLASALAAAAARRASPALLRASRMVGDPVAGADPGALPGARLPVRPSR